MTDTSMSGAPCDRRTHDGHTLRPTSPMTDTRVDVAIIGGGMVGASLAVALAGTGISTMLVEGTAPGSKIQPSFDDRTTALGNASRRIFQGLGVWERLAP